MEHLIALAASAVRIEHNENGPRLWLLGRRWHHWHSGVALVVVGIRWIYRDRADVPLTKRKEKP